MKASLYATDDGYCAIDTGPYHREVRCANAQAQRWFDRGCAWAGCFHREEAAYCFTMATEVDPQCAMAYWGIALCHGPDYNFHEKAGFYGMCGQESGYPSFKIAVNALEKGKSVATEPIEKALLEALSARYEFPVADTTPKLQQGYSDAMAKLALSYPDDVEVQIAYSESLMVLSPWDLYENVDPAATTPFWYSVNKKLNAIGEKVKVAVGKAYKLAPGNFWVQHLKIHLDEMGPVKDFDWTSAKAMRKQVDGTGLGHLIHMPTHLDIQVGDYESAMRYNIQAYKADLALFAVSGNRFTIYMAYMVHDMEFAAWGAMYGGKKQVALDAGGEITRLLNMDVMKSNPVVPLLFEAFTTSPLMVQIRFGLWDDVLAVPFNADKELYLSHTIMLHYARGVAFAAKGNVSAAKAEQARFAALVSKLDPANPTRLHHNVPLPLMTGIAEKVLACEIAYREGAHDAAFGEIEEAIKRFDALPYDEPHGWLMSVRQTAGALYAEQQKWDKAIEVYKSDLTLFPKNPWALAGLQRCYKAIGNATALKQTTTDLILARQLADVSIFASCACATKDWQHKEPPDTPKCTTNCSMS